MDPKTLLAVLETVDELLGTGLFQGRSASSVVDCRRVLKNMMRGIEQNINEENKPKAVEAGDANKAA